MSGRVPARNNSTAVLPAAAAGRRSPPACVALLFLPVGVAPVRVRPLPVRDAGYRFPGRQALPASELAIRLPAYRPPAPPHSHPCAPPVPPRRSPGPPGRASSIGCSTRPPAVLRLPSAAPLLVPCARRARESDARDRTGAPA